MIRAKRSSKHYSQVIKEGLISSIIKQPLQLTPKMGTFTPKNKEEGETYKVSLYATFQKLGFKPKSPQLSFLDKLDPEDNKNINNLNPEEKGLRDSIQQFNIKTAGADLTLSQSKALGVIEKLLYNTQYKGNEEIKELDGKNIFKYKGILPRISFTPSQYLDLFGVKKYQTARGYNEYSGQEREEALQSLKDLADRRFFIFYQRKYKDEKGKDRVDIIKAVRPLLNILEGYEGLNQEEANKVMNLDPSAPKVTHLIIEPSPILIDQIDCKYILKPANIHEEAKAILGKKCSKPLMLLIDYILKEFTLNRTIIYNPLLDNLAYTLRLDHLIKSYQRQRYKRDILKYFAQAKQLGYITKYALVNEGMGDRIRYTINPNKPGLRAVKALP